MPPLEWHTMLRPQPAKVPAVPAEAIGGALAEAPAQPADTAKAPPAEATGKAPAKAPVQQANAANAKARPANAKARPAKAGSPPAKASLPRAKARWLAPETMTVVHEDSKEVWLTEQERARHRKDADATVAWMHDDRWRQVDPQDIRIGRRYKLYYVPTSKNHSPGWRQVSTTGTYGQHRVIGRDEDNNVSGKSYYKGCIVSAWVENV